MTQTERTARSDKRMFEAAVQQIVELGPQRAKLTEIGVLAGYSRGLAAYRFGTKDVFYSALIEHLHQAWCAELDQATEGTSGHETVIAAVTALQNFVKSDPDRLHALFKLYYHSIDHDSDTTRRLQKIQVSQRRQAARWVRDCADTSVEAAEDFAEQYCSLVFGSIYQWLVNPEAIDLVGLLERCKRTLATIAPG